MIEQLSLVHLSFAEHRMTKVVEGEDDEQGEDDELGGGVVGWRKEGWNRFAREARLDLQQRSSHSTCVWQLPLLCNPQMCKSACPCNIGCATMHIYAVLYNPPICEEILEPQQTAWHKL